MATETDPKIRDNTAESARNSRSLRPLMALAPYALAYRGRIVLAFLALTVAAAVGAAAPEQRRRPASGSDRARWGERGSTQNAQ